MRRNKNVRFDVWNTCYLYETDFFNKEIIWWSECEIQAFKISCINEIRSILERHNVSLTEAKDILLNSQAILDGEESENCCEKELGKNENNDSDNISEITISSNYNKSSDSLDSLDEKYPIETWQSKSTIYTWKSVNTEA